MIVEDGTGLATADALIDVAYADAYHAARGNTAWTGSDAVKEAAIIRATDYMGTLSWRSAPLKADQGTAWPRVGYDGVPVAVKKATAEYALRSMSGALEPDPTADPAVEEVTKKVGPMTTARKYRASVAARRRSYPAADRLISGYLASCRGVYV